MDSQNRCTYLKVKTNIDKLVDANIIDVGFDLGVTNQSKPRRPWQKALQVFVEFLMK